jgi:hypothetical protein
VQVCTPFPEHCVCPGAHTPEHTPPTHVWLLHAAGAPQLPVASQVSTPLPTQRTEPGKHATQVLLKQAGVPLEHVVCVCQVPVASQDWMSLPRHCVCPGAHTPAHAPAVQV